MLRIDRRISVTLSYLFCAIAFLGIVALGILLAFDNSLSVLHYDSALLRVQGQYRFWTYLLEYAILALVLFADICLVLVLNNVRRGSIFTDRSVQYLRLISWASVLAGAAAVPLCVFLRLPSLLCLAFIGFFLGAVLRVVKNVIEEGTAIKEENDGTI